MAALFFKFFFYPTSKKNKSGLHKEKNISRFGIKRAFSGRDVGMWLSEVSCDSVHLQEVIQDLEMKGG